MSGSTPGTGPGARPESRPRPEYGEYATPEEQRAAIKQPEDYYDWLTSNRTGEAQPDAPQQPARSALGDPARDPRLGADPHARPVPRPRGADRVATFALLALGLFDTVSALLGTSSYGDAMVAGMRSAGLSGVDAAMLPSWLGYVVAAVDVVLWLAALWLSLASMRRGRLSFWIPLSAGAAAALVGGVIVAVALTTNPDFLQILSGLTSSSGSSSGSGT